MMRNGRWSTYDHPCTVHRQCNTTPSCISHRRHPQQSGPLGWCHRCAGQTCTSVHIRQFRTERCCPVETLPGGQCNTFDPPTCNKCWLRCNEPLFHCLSNTFGSVPWNQTSTCCQSHMLTGHRAIVCTRRWPGTMPEGRRLRHPLCRYLRHEENHFWRWIWQTHQ
jgi:hypothetical protein